MDAGVSGDEIQLTEEGYGESACLANAQPLRASLCLDSRLFLNFDFGVFWPALPSSLNMKCLPWVNVFEHLIRSF